jgi:phage tail sheath gpL-like
MALQKAVASSVKTPGVYLSINMLGGSANPGTAARRALLMAPKGSAGNITANTEVRRCNGASDVSIALGAGTPGHLAAKRFFLKNPLGSLDVVAPTASAGAAATATQTFTGPATENSTIRFRIHGRTIEVSWLSGESAATFVARAVAAINQLSDDLFVIASDAGSGSILYTAKVNGPWGNDVRLYAAIYTGGGGIAVSVNPTNATGGTTEPSFATAFATVSATQYRRIICCLSNADATDTTSSSNAERLANHIAQYLTGRGAKLQVGVVGHTGSTANAKAGAIDRNSTSIEYVLGRSWDDLPGELAGDEAGDALAGLSLRANYNRIGNPTTLYGPRDIVTNKLSDAETEDLLSNGVTPLDVDALTGARFLVEPITTHSVSTGAPDYRAYHLSDIDAMYEVVDGLRVALPQEFPNASVTQDLAAGGDPLPAGVVERRDVEAFTVSYLRGWARQGVLASNRLDAAIAGTDPGGALAVEIDDIDEAQVNIFLPLAIIKPLAKFGVAANKVA